MWTNQQILAEQLVRISEGVAISLHVVENLHPSICYACQQANLLPLPINIAAIPIFPVSSKQQVEIISLFDSGASAAD